MYFAEKASKDLEMKQWLYAQLLKPDNSYLYFENEQYHSVKFLGFDTVYYGRLANPGTKPGKYWDHTRAIIDIEGEQKIVDITRLSFSCALGNTNYLDAVDELPNTWYLIDLAKYFMEELPITKFVESDVVRLIDENHDNYTGDLLADQYTVYRVYYETASQETIYKLRAGKTIFEAKESQLLHAADGPIRILEAQKHPLTWRSLKDEAEFHLLIGKFTRVFNPYSYSYKWNLAEPSHFETVRETLAYAMADSTVMREGYWELVIFDDRELGRQVAGAGDLLLNP